MKKTARFAVNCHFFFVYYLCTNNVKKYWFLKIFCKISTCVIPQVNFSPDVSSPGGPDMANGLILFRISMQHDVCHVIS